MSGKLITTSKKVQSLSKEAQNASKSVAHMANKFKSSVEQMVSKATKLAGVGASIAGTLALKTGFGEAMNLEGFKTQLETATKSAQKAGEIMKWSVNLANSTPFETGQVVEMASKFEAMGMSVKKWGAITGDMAGSTNKDLIQATEAIVDTQNGELDRLKEFGIQKQQIADKANELFAGRQVINNKNQIVDQEKFNEALMALMEDRFKGGAEKQSKTLKGMWSTVTGLTKISLSKIVGMQEDGTVKQGSLYEKLKEKIQLLSDKFQQWQKDGTIDKIAETTTNVFTKVFDVISKIVTFVIKHKELIKTIIVAVGGFSVAIKIVSAFKKVVMGLQIVWAIFSGTLALSPLGWVVIGITALITVGYLLIKNWDKIKEKVKELWAIVVEKFMNIKNKVSETVTKIIDLISSVFPNFGESIRARIEAIKQIFRGLITFFTGVFSGDWSKAWEGLKDIFAGIFNRLAAILLAPFNLAIDIINKIIEKINGISFDIPDWLPDWLGGGKTFKVDIPKIGGISIPKFATGTQYFKGGLANINEHGGEIVNLPNGSKVIPADKSKNILSKNNAPIINVYIQGNVIGNEDYANYIATVIARKLKETAPNVG